MAHKSDVPKNFEIWAGGPNGLRLRKHPKLDEALIYLDEFPMLIRKAVAIGKSESDKLKINLSSIPAFRRSSVGETVELSLEIDCPAIPVQGPVQFARLFIETGDTLLEEHLILKAGKRQALQLPFPAFETETGFTVSLELRDQGQSGYIKAHFVLKPEKRLTFYYAFQTHLDLGWTDRVGPTIEALKRMTGEVAINVCREFMKRPEGERFIWTCECSDALRLAWDGADESQREILRDFIRKELIQCCAFPFSFHTGLMSKDLLKRSIARSYALRDEIGVPELDLSVAQSNDVPGHSWIVPDVLAETGIRRAMIGHNSMVRGCKLPPLFYWQGPEGGKVLTYASSCVDYGAEFPVPKSVRELAGLSVNNPEAFQIHGTALIRTIGYGENCGPEGAEREINTITAWNEQFVWPKLVIGAPKDYFNHIEPEIEPDKLPVVTREISDWWIDGPASMPTAMNQFRRAMILLPRLDQAIPPDDATSRKLLAEAEANLILHSEHTFGMNAQLVKPTACALKWQLDGLENYEGSWNDKELYADTAFNICKKLCDKYLRSLPVARRTPDWNISWNENGISSLIDPHGKCRYDRSAGQPFANMCQHLLDKELDEWFHHNPYAAPNPGDNYFMMESIREIDGEVVMSGKLDSPAGSIESVTIKIGNAADSPDLIVKVVLKGKQPTAQAEYLTLALPFLLEAPIYRTDVGGSLLTIDSDQLPDSNCDEHPVITGWTVDDLAISSAEVFLWHFGNLRYCRWNKTKGKRGPTAYAHLCNNVWNTNFRCWNGGDFEFNLRIRCCEKEPLAELRQMSELW